MHVTKTMRPGERGTGRFQRRYGERLVKVRYRKSACESRLFTTVEIIVDEREAPPPGVSHDALNASRRAEPVALEIKYDEIELRALVKKSGGRWNPRGRAWVIRRDVAVGLGLAHRINERLLDECSDIDTSVEVI